MEYQRTLSRVESYFDDSATEVWARLTSDAPVSKIRATVRAGRDEMRARLIGALPKDLQGLRILDAGCGTGQMACELAERGAIVHGVDISPALIGIAQARCPAHLADHVSFFSGDLRDVTQTFDAVVAMDSLIYYRQPDLIDVLGGLAQRAPQILYTVAPRTPLLMTMWHTGKLFPRSDRAPVMTPQAPARLIHAWDRGGEMRDLGRVARGFYISQAMEVQV
ncbi:MAG: magnesium protoporphyrin IX methyltransferase [Rhodobacteraceae bacterium]|nr:magnesium protoporphyrin IX methyltransferase [Paracoccaceae bacterium]